jgi:hypothetical protein
MIKGSNLNYTCVFVFLSTPLPTFVLSLQKSSGCVPNLHDLLACKSSSPIQCFMYRKKERVSDQTLYTSGRGFGILNNSLMLEMSSPRGKERLLIHVVPSLCICFTCFPLSEIFHSHSDVTNAGQEFGAHDVWACEALYLASPIVTWNFGFWRQHPFSKGSNAGPHRMDILLTTSISHIIHSKWWRDFPGVKD